MAVVADACSKSLMTEAARHAPIRMYSTQFCPFCVAARRLFEHHELAYEDIAVDAQPELRQQMMIESGRNTVPQIWIGDTHIGGCDELYSLHDSGKLESFLYPVT